MYSRIMVPLDGSELAEIVLAYAGELAHKMGGELDIVSVATEPEHSSERLFKAYLDRIANGLADTGVKTRSIILYGSPATEIIGYAAKNKIELIAMATHGRSGISHWVIGSVAEKVLREASIPVLLIAARVFDTIPVEKTWFKRILVPLDGSDLGALALPWVEEIAKKTAAKLYLFHVSLPAYKLTGTQEFAVGHVEELVEGVRVAAREYINSVAEDLKKKEIDVQYELVVGTPAEAILDYAKEKNIDLIAMSTHGRTGVSRWVFGSVADKVLHASELPILMVRAPQTAHPKRGR